MPPGTELDKVMSKRRVDLGMRWREVAEEAGISYETLRAIRRGDNPPSPLTKRGIERALRWAEGGFEDAVAGREPATESPSGAAPYADLSDPHERVVWESQAPEELKRQIIDLIRRGRRGAGRSEQTG